MIRTAVIGVGSMGKHHARIYWELPDIELVGVADPDIDIANSIANKYNTKAYSDYKILLDEQRPDAVTIAVPTSLHNEIALEVIKRGIHLLIEKPIARSVEEGLQIIQAAEDNKVILTVGHVERFNPAVIYLKDQISRGALGRIFQIDARRQGPFPARINDIGVVIDLAVHDLDIMRYITGAEIIRVFAETDYRIGSHYEDLMTAIVRMNNNTVGTLAINWLTPAKIRELYVTGEKGMYRVDYITQDLYFYENATANTGDWEALQVLRGVSEGKMVRYVINKKEPLKAEQEAFLDAIQNKTSVIVTGFDGLRALELAQAVITAGLNHQVVNTNS